MLALPFLFSKSFPHSSPEVAGDHLKIIHDHCVALASQFFVYKQLSLDVLVG
jgi:hypothetical protein